MAGDCASCHTADAAKPFAGGKRIETPFGGIYAPNLTPDRETGLGGWSEADFYQALRFGVAPDGSRYYPAFPYPNFTILVRDDILAIRAYLGTLAPVSNKAPPPQLRFPLNFRVVMRAWNWLYFKPGIIVPDQTKGSRLESRALSGRGARSLRRLSHAEEHLRRRQARPGVWRRTGRRHVRAKARWCGARRAEIVEHGGHHRISAERAQRQEPCRQADVGSHRQLHLENERWRRPRHRGLSQIAAGRRSRACRRAAPAGADGRRREGLSRRLHCLPRGGWLQRAADLPAAAGQREPAAGRSGRAPSASSSTAPRP